MQAYTGAAIAGRLLGAVYGGSAVPARWRDAVHGGRKTYRADDLQTLAIQAVTALG